MENTNTFNPSQNPPSAAPLPPVSPPPLSTTTIPPSSPPPSPIPAPPSIQTPPTSPNNQPSQENPTITPQTPPPSGNKSSLIVKVVFAILFFVLMGVAAYFAYTYLFISTSPKPTTPNTTGQNSTEDVTLTYWGLWEDDAILSELFQEYEQQTGVKIDYQIQSPKEYRERLQSELAKGTGPDIFRFHNTWVPMFKNELTPMPETIMTLEEYQNTFYPVAVRDLNAGETFLGIPLMIDGLGLYYNQAFFETASKTVPTTWDDLRQTALDLTIRNKNTIERAGVALGLTSNVDHFSDIIATMLIQEGINPGNPSGSGAENVFRFYQIFSKTDKVWDSTFPPSTFSFATEKVAMIIAPSWRAHEISQINPNLDFAIAPLPLLPDTDKTWATYWVEGVSAKSQHQQQAWELLKFLSTKDNLRKLYTSASNTRLFGEPFPRVDMADQLIGDKFVGAFIQQAPKAVSFPLASRTFDNGINDQTIKFYEDAINAGGNTDAISTLQKGVQATLGKYGIPKLNPLQ